MKRLLVGIAPTIVVLVHAMAPPTAEAHWFGRCGGWYSPRYTYGYGSSSCYRPSYYGYSNSSYGGYGGYGGNSALTTILAMSGGLGANTSMYMTVPMSNGYGPASLLQVPIGGAAGRSTFLQVPVGGGPGQPIYLQMELGGGTSAPPANLPSRPLGSTTVPTSDRLAIEDAVDSAAVPYVVASPAPQRSAATTQVAADSADDAQGSSHGLFRFAVFERPQSKPETTVVTPAKSVGLTTENLPQTTTVMEPLDLGPNFGAPLLRTLSDGDVPWQVK